MSRYQPLSKPSTSGQAAATQPCLRRGVLAFCAPCRRQWRSAPRRAAGQVACQSFRQADEEYMKEYQALKDGLMDNTRKSGGAIAAYLLFTVDGTAALCVLVGTAFSIAYLNLLYRDVDSYTGDTVVPMSQAEQIEDGTVRTVAKVLAAYQQALQPRLLVLVALAAGSWAFNAALGPELALDRLHMGCLLGGFLAYKGALLLKVVDDQTPKTFNDASSYRPRVEQFDDELDRWGRPKPKLVRMPTEALPEGAEPEKMPLTKLIMAMDEAAAADRELLEGSGRASSDSDDDGGRGSAKQQQEAGSAGRR